MIDGRQTPPLADEILVAYLDHQLNVEQRAQVEQRLAVDPALAERLAWLDRASLPFEMAYAGLLAQAPAARLRRQLAAIGRETAADVPARQAGRRRLIAATLAGLALGAVGGRFIPQPGGKEESGGWRDTVAQYMSLYTTETITGRPDAPELLHRRLQNVGHRLGLELDAQHLRLPGAELKDARLLRYDRQPLAQIVYLDRQARPMALCITRAQDADPSAAATEVRRGMHVAYWSAHGLDYMLIGHESEAELLVKVAGLPDIGRR